MTIERVEITGVVLAGGRGSRMGGVDKGLQNYRGMPLAMNAMLRLAPQVGEVMINANRNLAAYESMGVPVWPDVLPDFAGPLAGWLTGLEHCTTPYLVTVPCDTPGFPLDLVARLAAKLDEADAQVAMVTALQDGERNLQPIFSLLRSTLLESLTKALNEGERKVARWAAKHRFIEVLFEDGDAFYNANTVEELQTLERRKTG
jgi:molybdopterin-guanine dinucleotide biosynthesis protein A